MSRMSKLFLIVAVIMTVVGAAGVAYGIATGLTMATLSSVVTLGIAVLVIASLLAVKRGR